MADGKRASDDDFSIIGGGENDGAGSGASIPNGSDKSGIVGLGAAVDPAQARGDAASGEYSGRTNKDGSPAKKRGRKPGQGSQKADNSPHIESGDIEGTAAILLAIHSFLAVQVPEMQMTEPEAMDVAKAFARVERHYPGVQKILSVKVKDHVAFFGTLGRVYGSRIAAVRLRKEQEKRGNEAVDITNGQPENVHPFHAR